MAGSKSGFARTWATMVFFLKTHRKATAVALLVVLGLILVFQNTHPVRTYIFFWSLRLPLILWAGLYALLGYAAGKGIEWAYQKRRRIRGGASASMVAGSPGKTGDASDPSASSLDTESE